MFIVLHKGQKYNISLPPSVKDSIEAKAPYYKDAVVGITKKHIGGGVRYSVRLAGKGDDTEKTLEDFGDWNLKAAEVVKQLRDIADTLELLIFGG